MMIKTEKANARILAERPRQKNAKQRKIALQCYAMLAAPIIGYVVFTIYPILWTFAWSLFSYNGILIDARFVGLDNFKTLFTTDLTYWHMWGNTLLLALMKMPVELTLAMGLALLLSRWHWASGFFRSAFYLPSVVSVAVIGLIFSNMFSYFGIVNGILMKTGLIQTEIDWFGSKWSAMLVLTVASIWNTFGINVMYLLAALTNVPKELYEAAAMDGASGKTVFFKVTLPMIAPVFQTILLLSLVGTLGVNDLILALTNGAPGGESFSVMAYLTRQFMPGFRESAALPALGYGCSMSVLTTVIFGAVAYSYSRFSKKLNELT